MTSTSVTRLSVTSGVLKRQRPDVTCIERHYSVRFQPLRVDVILLLIFKNEALIKNNLVGTLAAGVELVSVYGQASLSNKFKLKDNTRAQTNRSHIGRMNSALSFSWRLPNEIKEDYLSGKLNSIFFVSAGNENV